MKVIIVGGVAGGATTATRLRRLSEKNEIILFERGENISFANCGLPYYISNVISKKENLLVQTPKAFKERFNIDVRIKQKVVKINRENKTVTVKNLSTNEIYEETYDKLVLSPGAEPINPFKNLNSNRIFTLRTIEDSIKIKEYIKNNEVKNVAIIGGGYIGVEMAENLSQINNFDSNKLNITIVEKSSHLIPTIDLDMASFIHKIFIKNKINIILNQGVESIVEGEKLFVKLENSSLKVDMCILCIGIRPESTLAKEAELSVNERGYIIVNEKMQTSDENIYAIGDVVLLKNLVTSRKAPLALAGPANRQARIVANNIMNMDSNYDGFIGSSILKIFDHTLGMTGISEKVCKEQNISYKIMEITPNSHASYYPGAKPITIKAIYEGKSGRILGATVWGEDKVDKITDCLAIAIRKNMTAFDLSEFELSYAPPYSSAKSPVNILGNSIENEILGLVETISVTDFINNFKVYSNKEKYLILDVRTKKEYELSHIEGAINIPLDELRENILNETEKNKEIIVHCHSGLRSYIACRILKENGFNCKNLIGGYLMYDTVKRYSNI